MRRSTPAPGPPRRAAGRYRLDRIETTTDRSTHWSAYDELLGRPVTVVELEVSEAQERDQVRHDAHAAARLGHPAVARVLDVIDEAGRVVVVHQRADGPTLADIVARDGALTTRRAAAVGAVLADALDAAHRLSVVHGAVTPQAVTLTAEGPVLSGFASDVGGSPREDVRALAATLGAATAGEESADSAFAEVMSRLRASGGGGPSAAEASVLLRNLAGPAAARETTAQASATRFDPEGTAPARGTLAAPPAPVRRLARPTPSRRTGLLVAGVALLAAALIGGSVAVLRPAGAPSGPTALPSPAVSTGAATAAGPSVAPSAAPSAAPSTAPPPDAPAVAVPADWQRYRAPAGWSVQHPGAATTRVRRDGLGDLTYFGLPAGALVGVADPHVGGDAPPTGTAAAAQAQLSGSLPGYDLVRIDPVTVRGWNAADWEFTYVGAGGRLHVLTRIIDTGAQDYALVVQLPASTWADRGEATMAALTASFRAAAPSG